MALPEFFFKFSFSAVFEMHYTVGVCDPEFGNDLLKPNYRKEKSLTV